MRVNITGLLRSAQALIHPEEDRGAYAYMLGELIGHIEDVRSGKHTLEEFADFYCMAPKPDLSKLGTAIADAVNRAA